MTSIQRSNNPSPPNSNQQQQQPQQPAIVIDPAVKESMYSLIEAQRHSHELVVTQLMVALEETHRECRFLRQQLATSNEMLQDSQLQLRRAVDDKEVLFSKIQSSDDECNRVKQENSELKARVQDDMKELVQVREMVKNAMEETYRASNRTHQQFLQNQEQQQQQQQQQQQHYHQPQHQLTSSTTTTHGNNNDAINRSGNTSPSRRLLNQNQSNSNANTVFTSVPNYYYHYHHDASSPNSQQQQQVQQQEQDYYSPPANNNINSNINRNMTTTTTFAAYQGYGSSDFPASVDGLKASVAFAAVSPPRARDGVSGTSDVGEYRLVSQQQQQQQAHRFESPVDLSIHRNSRGEMTIRADPNHMTFNGNSHNNMMNQKQQQNFNLLIAPSIMNSNNSNSNNDINNDSHQYAASVPRSMIGTAPTTTSSVAVAYGGGAAASSSSSSSSTSHNANIFRPITVDMKLSKGISVSPQGHVSISIANEELNQAALCVYGDLRGSANSNIKNKATSIFGSTLIFEASFRSRNPKNVLVGLATLLNNNNNNSGDQQQQQQHHLNISSSSSSSFSDAIAAASGLGARCAIRGDGVMLLATDDGNVFEAKSGLAVSDSSCSSSSSSGTSNGVISVRLEEMTSRVVFSVNGDHIRTVPLQVPKAISCANMGSLVPFVSLPCSGDEVVVRAPASVVVAGNK